MIIKLRYILVIIIVLSIDNLYCQNIISDSYLDVENKPVLNLYGDIDKPDSIIYITRNNRFYQVDSNVTFIGGSKALDLVCDSLYYAKYFRGYEINTRFNYIILFNSNLQIQEVRIIKSMAYEPLFYKKYYDIVKKIILLTKDKWQIEKKSSCKWYIFIGTIKIT